MVSSIAVARQMALQATRPRSTPDFSKERDAVHQRPIETEQKRGLDAHRPGLLERALLRASGAEKQMTQWRQRAPLLSIAIPVLYAVRR
jgi:hypothetical protein